MAPAPPTTMLSTVTEHVQRPCPSCEAEGRGSSRIGNLRASCRTCNAFARRLERRVSRVLREQADDEALARLTEDAESRLYADLMSLYADLTQSLTADLTKEITS